MENIPEIVEKAFTEQIYKCVISNPVQKSEKYKKIELQFLDGLYHIEKHTATQVFHEKMTYEKAKDFIQDMLEKSYKNFHAWSSDKENSVQISKKGKVTLRTTHTKTQNAPKRLMSHNREKNYILQQGLYIEPLVDMGIFTKEGQVIQSMYDKYKQINRFIEIVDDEIKKQKKEEWHILDFGCGKSYLTFILYYYFTEIRKMKVKMTGLDLKKEVIEKCNAAAQKYGYNNLSFQVGDIGNFQYENKVDVVITLHACDTATDFALHNAICWNADMIFSVPCCQHELNGQIQSDAFSILTRYGIVKERMAALMTDTIRCNLLSYCGYKTQMVEFVAFDHTPKNIMIRAVKRKNGKRQKDLEEVQALMEEFHVSPTLYSLLEKSNHLSTKNT